MLPKEFLMIPRQKKEGKTYKNDPGVMKQLKIIKHLFEEADSIICATDSAREGEAIFLMGGSYDTGNALGNAGLLC